jgi:DNA/RNA endonuclease YhcR with UshA esterase domain
MSIFEAREQEKGTGVLVQGVVTVLPGIFGVQYLYIYDGLGGIAVYQYKKDFPSLKTGDMVRVQGTISEANGQKRINIKQARDIAVLKVGQEVPAMNIDFSELEEQPLGALVKVVGDITEKKSGYWYVDDGSSEAVVYFKQGTKINQADFLEGQTVEVVGVLEEGKNGLQIWPRQQDDIKIVGMAKELEKQVVKESWGTYFSAAAGAATTLLLGFFARARGLMFLAWFSRGAKAIAAVVRRG